MKREFLKQMGITDEAIERILSESGKELSQSVEEAKAKASEDFDAVKRSAEDYRAKLEQTQKDMEQKLSKTVYQYEAERFVDALKPKDQLSKKAVLTEFSTMGFKLEDGQFVGGKEWAEGFKKENESHFEGEKQLPTIFSGKLGGSVDTKGDTGSILGALKEQLRIN